MICTLSRSCWDDEELIIGGTIDECRRKVDKIIKAGYADCEWKVNDTFIIRRWVAGRGKKIETHYNEGPSVWKIKRH
jgi:hypothetical protein